MIGMDGRMISKGCRDHADHRPVFWKPLPDTMELYYPALCDADSVLTLRCNAGGLQCLEALGRTSGDPTTFAI